MLFALTLFSIATAGAVNASTPVEMPAEPTSAITIGVGQGKLGNYLTGPDGRTLYVFTVDAPNQSNCDAGCRAVWPPLLATDEISPSAAVAPNFGTIETEAGPQVTYNGAPLYYYAGDSKAGDTNGHLIGGVWFVARPESASTAVLGVRQSDDSSYLVAPNGMTLYFFANDQEGVSNCADQCIRNWPALTVPEGMEPTAVADASGELGVHVRGDDGSSQVTYNGRPLYFFAGDQLPGETKGDGVGGVWSLARP